MPPLLKGKDEKRRIWAFSVVFKQKKNNKKYFPGKYYFRKINKGESLYLRLGLCRTRFNYLFYCSRHSHWFSRPCFSPPL
ncbi:MAG TPA: hypothetical protein DHV84_06890 [Desulfotomaculum sp.]|nr:hypothetical protein [Desulfotomaculum sp.]